MAQLPRKPHDDSAPLDRSDGPLPTPFPTQFSTVSSTRVSSPFPTRFPSRSADPDASSQVRVRTHAIRNVAVLEVAGRLDEVIEDLDWAIQLALSTGPRGVACDLSAVVDASDSGLELLATAGRHVRDWHGIPVAVASPDPRVRDALSAYPLGGQLIVTKSMLSALYAVLRTPSPAVEWLQLAPHPTAPGAARNFVTRTLLDWRLAMVLPSACLVVSELVTNSTLYAGTGSDIDVSVSWDQHALRLTVRDHSPDLPREQHPGLDLHGRGLTIVAGVSRAFGVLPTSDGGKVVWAVLDAPRLGSSARRPSDNAIATREPSVPKGLGALAALAAVAAAAEPTEPTPPASAPHPAARLHRMRPAKEYAAAGADASGRVALATRTTAPRPFAVGRVGPSQHSRPHPYRDSSNDLG